MKNTNKICIVLLVSIISLVVGIGVNLWYINKNTIHIPKVYFEGDISNMTDKKDEREIKIKYKSDDKTFETYAKIKIQGTSSIYYDKKNYNITLYTDESFEEKNKIEMNEEWGNQSKYCLKANWIDKTHSKNIVTARLAASAQEKYTDFFANTPHSGTIDGFPIEVYNNGELLGIYTWNIPKDEWLWNMDDENPNHIVIGAGVSCNETTFRENASGFSELGWEVEVGPENDETLEKLNRLVDFIKNSTDEEFVEHYDEYLDKDSVLNYISFVAVTEAIDNINKNLMLVTYDGEIWAPSLYDLDTVFGTSTDGSKIEDLEEFEVGIDSNLLFERTIDNFPNELANRYFELRQDLLSKENIMNEFEMFKSCIPERLFKKEAKIWGEIPGEDITEISKFLDVRLTFIDNHMKNLYEN